MKRKLLSLIVPLLVMSFSFGQTMTLTSYQTGVASDITVNYTVSNATGVVGTQLWVPAATGTYQSLSSPELVVKINGVIETPVSGSASSFDWGNAFAVSFRFSSTIQVGDVIDISVTGLMINPTSAGTQTGVFRTNLNNGGAVETFTEVLNFTTPVSPPSITSFSPRSAEVGDAVTITGTDFSSTASDNIVYFGGAKATVNSATATSLNVTVPVHAMDRPISVTTNGFTDESSLAFDVINSVISSVSVERDAFADAITYTSSSPSYDWADNSHLIDVADFDQDGKVDLVRVGGSSDKKVTVHRNTATVSEIDAGTFAAGIDFSLTTSNTSRYNSVRTGDLNNDGKKDIVTINEAGDMFVLINNSSSGTISFLSAQQFSISNSNTNMELADFDGDGLIDVMVADNYTSTFNVYLNTSSTALSFGTAVNISGMNNGTREFTSGDVNGDGLVDIIGGAYPNSTIAINTSSNGSVSFNMLSIPTSGNSFSVADFDNDGDNDLVSDGGVIYENNFSGSGSISASDFNSISLSLNYSFGSYSIAYQGPSSLNRMSYGDFDGDGNMDWFSTYWNSGNRNQFIQNNTTGLINANSFDYFYK
ncbi:MAG: FG-GAP-like repeat-containing protein, partial [Flavobacteriales bacterium]